MAATSGYSNATIELLDLESGERKVLHSGGSMGRYLPSGQVVFVREGTLFGLPFDLERREVTGAPVPLLEELTFSENHGDAWLATSTEGTVVYRLGERAQTEQRIIELDLQGNVSVLLEKPDLYQSPKYSPDGSRVAFGLGQRSDSDVWIYEIDRNDKQRLTFSESSDGWPQWTPDGSRIVFSSDRRGAHDLFWKPADGSGESEPLTETESYQFAGGWSPDGKILTYMEFGAGAGTGVDFSVSRRRDEDQDLDGRQIEIQPLVTRRQEDLLRYA